MEKDRGKVYSLQFIYRKCIYKSGRYTSVLEVYWKKKEVKNRKTVVEVKVPGGPACCFK